MYQNINNIQLQVSTNNKQIPTKEYHYHSHALKGLIGDYIYFSNYFEQRYCDFKYDK